MRLLIGVDEAGYGPNLGPLVVAASCWRLPKETNSDLYATLQDAVALRWERSGRLAIADSKKIHQGPNRLARLEQGVLACLTAAGGECRTGRDLWRALAADLNNKEIDASPWCGALEQEIPVAAKVEEISAKSQCLSDCLAQEGVALLSLRARALFPGEFNRRTEAEGTKGAVLSQTTVDLIGSILHEHEHDDVLITCDKHGGRNKYAPLLLPLTEERLVEVVVEGTAESRYRWRTDQRSFEIGFFAGGERYLPSALASMTAKYLRELSMLAFNEFWIERLPGLKPTAGYPVDARRFEQQTRTLRRQMGVDDAFFWRNR